MPLSNPCPGIERKVIALACVAITDRPIVPHPVDRRPFRYVLRLRIWRVRHEPYAAIPPRVPRNTSQSAMFMRRSGRTPRAGPQRGQTTRIRTGTRRARHGIRADRAARRRTADQTVVDRSFTQGDEIGKQPIGSGHTLRKLPKPRKTGVDEIPLALPRHEQTAAEGRFPGIAERQDRRETLIPFIWEIQAALLHPAVEICCSDAIWTVQHRVIGCQEGDGRFFVRDAVARNVKLDGCQPVCAQAGREVVLYDDISARLDILEQRRYMVRKILPGVESPDADDDGIQ